MKKYLVSLSIIVILIAIFCLTSFRVETGLDFNRIVKEVNQERKSRVESSSEIDINQYAYNVKGDKEGFTKHEIEILLQPRAQKKGTISKEAALEDTEYLFKIFRYVYGGYGYYGGDEVFNPVKGEVLKRINSKDKLSINELNTIFGDQLSFITDGHLNIGKMRINKKHIFSYYCNQQIEVRKNNKGFYFIKDNEKRYLKSINKTEEIEKYLKLSINKDGELIYYIGLLQNDEKAKLSLPIEFYFHSKIKRDVLGLVKADRKHYRNPIAFEQKIIEGILILICRSLDDRSEENSLKYFVESGSKAKNENVFIIDLRGNRGGGFWSYFWFEDYTGTKPQTGMSSMKRYSKLYLYRQKKFQNNNLEPFLQRYNMPRLYEKVDTYFQEMNKALNNKTYDVWEVEKTESKWIENENIIFVLVDKSVASSAETFVNQLKTLNNVVLVGTNTSGIKGITDMQLLYLPNSNIEIQIGVGIDIFKGEPHFIHGVGFKPDIWLDKEDLLERVIKLSNHYNLNK